MNTTHVSYKRFGCQIRIHNNSFKGSSSKIVKRFDGFTFEQFMKWRWYFRYLTAKHQVNNPRVFVELDEFNYEFIPEKQDQLKRLKNRAKSARAKITEWKNKLIKFEKSYTEIFPITENPYYIKAMNKVNEKECLLNSLLKDIDALNQ